MEIMVNDGDDNDDDGDFLNKISKPALFFGCKAHVFNSFYRKDTLQGKEIVSITFLD